MKTLLAVLFALNSQFLIAGETSGLFYSQLRADLYKELAHDKKDILSLNFDQVNASLKSFVFAADESQAVKECIYQNLSTQDGLKTIRDFVINLKFVYERSTIISKSIANLPKLGFHEHQLDTQIWATSHIYQGYLEKEVLFKQLFGKTAKLCK